MEDTFVQPLTRVEAAVQEIRRRIFDGSFPAGYQLKQERLAEQFGMSRIPLREAFRQLEAEGLISITPHKGAVVSEISLSEIEELFNLRALLECRLLRASAPKLTPEDFEHLDDLLISFGRDLRANRIAKWGEMNTKLHMYLYRHCGQPRTLAIVHNLLTQTDRFTRLQIAVTGGQVRAQEQHFGLVLRCREGLFDEAVDLLKSHIENGGTVLKRSGLFGPGQESDAADTAAAGAS
jgi:DNA-binding GntR family transcriptional regulator